MLSEPGLQDGPALATIEQINIDQGSHRKGWGGGTGAGDIPSEPRIVKEASRRRGGSGAEPGRTKQNICLWEGHSR